MSEAVTEVPLAPSLEQLTEQFQQLQLQKANLKDQLEQIEKVQPQIAAMIQLLQQQAQDRKNGFGVDKD